MGSCSVGPEPILLYLAPGDTLCETRHRYPLPTILARLNKATRPVLRRIALKLLALFVLLPLFILLTGSVQAEPPECDMGACSILKNMVCFEIADSQCTAIVLGESVRYDTSKEIPDWTVIGGITCDNCCGGEPQKVTYHYQESQGYSYCITIGSGVGIVFPGIGWEVHSETEVCHDATTTVGIDVDVHCNPESSQKAVILERIRPVIITTRVQYSKWAEYVPRDPSPPGCDPDGPTTTLRRECTVKVIETPSLIHEYRVEYQNVECETDENGDIVCPQ